MNWQQLDLTLSGLRQHYLNGDFTPRELVEYLLTLHTEDMHHVWIERLTPAQLNPYLTALEDKHADSLPLYGVPFAIKDNIDLAGVDTTAACEAYRYTPASHASVVKRLVDAGAIPMGKTNMDQFATGLVGTRSPWGACKNAFNREYISGGSSSGSAVATSLGLVSFALGTDTAGSGRVPAAFNNLIGLKPSRGLISAAGVIPACQSLDCVTFFSLTVDDANQLLSIAEGFDAQDPYSRNNTFDNSKRSYASPAQTLSVGVPQTENLQFFGDETAQALFEKAIQAFKQQGHQLIEVDITPLLQAARLLYEGPWVTERFIAIESLITEQPETLLPVIETIIGKGKDFSSSDTFKAYYALQAYRQQSDQLFDQIDALITPTAATCFTIDNVNENPIQLNSQLGTYTNFMNLLDLCAIAVPAGFLDCGVGFGITLQAPALHDRMLMSLANQYCSAAGFTLGASSKPMPAGSIETVQSHFVDLVVCGAHLQGMSLNWQLTERGASKQLLTTTAQCYRLCAMDDGRPALFRDTTGGAIEVEVWRLSKQEFGSFVAAIPPPLGIGKVELLDGRWLPSFIAEPRAQQNAVDITQLGGWRAYVNQSS